MKPSDQVQEQCDNLQPNGTCLGVTLNDQLQIVRFQKEGSPCLVTSLKRCEHFERCILPYRPDNKDTRLAAKLQSEWAEASHAYRIATGYMAHSVRLCPQCKTSKIGKGRKICDTCKDKNRRATKAESDQKSKTVQQSHSSSIWDVDNQ